jgi:hypothetical protein
MLWVPRIDGLARVMPTIIELEQVCFQQPVGGMSQNAPLSITLGVQQEDPRHGNVGQPGEWHLIPSFVGLTVDQVKVELGKAGFVNYDEYIEIRGGEPNCAAGIVCRSAPEGPSRQRIDNRLVLYVGG